MTTYRWAVVDEETGEPIYGTMSDTRNGAEMSWSFRYEAGYRVAKFKLVECEEGEGDE